MILPKITSALPGPFALLGEAKITERPIAHEVSLAALGFGPVQPSRTRFRAYAPRYAYAPAEIVPIFCAAEMREKLDCVVIHDAQTLELLRTVEFPAETFTGDAACKAFGSGGCEYPKVIDLDTAGLPPRLLIINLITTKGRLSQPLLLLLRLPATAKGPRVAMMHASFTWQAYNTEGGASFYTAPPPRPLFSVSLHRPIDQRAANDYHNARSCLPFMRLFDEEQIPVRHFCNHDLHSDPGFLSGVEVLVLCGHDEYWTKEIRANIDAFIQRGGRVACFSGNTNWWQTKLVGDTLHLSQEDKQAPEPEFSGTGHMFASWIDNPIERRLGLGYLPGGYAVRYYHTEKQAEARGISAEDYGASRGITVVDATHPIFAGTELKTGEVFGADADIMYVEIDSAFLRADGRLDRTRWKFTPRNLKVLGRSLIFTASFPSMNFDPEGLFHIGAVLVEYPGTKSRGAVIHGGSVGWYRALSLRDPASSRIVLNAINYLLEAQGSKASSSNDSDERSPLPARLPPGRADLDRRSVLAGAGMLAATATMRPAQAQAPAENAPAERPALRTLAEWREMRQRAAAGDANAMVDLAARLLPEENIGVETSAEIYALLDKAVDMGNERALLLRYALAGTTFDGLNPFSGQMSVYEEKLRRSGSPLPPLADAINALNAGENEAYSAIREKLMAQSAPDEATRTLLAVEKVLPSGKTPDYSVAADLLGPSPSTPLGLAIHGQILAAAGKPRAAEQAFQQSVAAGYRPARLLLARLTATEAADNAQKRNKALLDLQSLGASGSDEALFTGAELAVQQAQTLADLAAFLPGLKTLADKGYGNAAYLVGLIYAAGMGIAPNPAEAVKYMQRCAATKHGPAEFQLGVWAYQGYGRPSDKAEAARLFESAAKQGEPRAMQNIGSMLVNGDGIPADAARGNEWLGKANAAQPANSWKASLSGWLRAIFR